MDEMRIDELAQRAGVPSRTIRYYTQQGLLAPPKLRGRVGFYTEAHLDRLKLIRELREKRFLPLSVIRQVVHRFESGEDLETMLTPLDIIFAPQWDDSPGELTRAELASEAGVTEEVVVAAEEMGFLFPVRRGRELRYTADDMHMLEVANQWLNLGLPTELGRLYRRSLEQISKLQVQAFQDSIVAPLAGRDVSPEQAREALVRGFKDMARTFDRLVNLLHRKLLQKAVESYAASRPDAED
ncbi:MAG TPA: MerR family transcriptional regulator [Actinomycetota bacterium]|nr:MerR family transcriptional regulator [Actinomycetota bacterium]